MNYIRIIGIEVFAIICRIISHEPIALCDRNVRDDIGPFHRIDYVCTTRRDINLMVYVIIGNPILRREPVEGLEIDISQNSIRRAINDCNPAKNVRT